jgi:aryl-alcohol dehydrogenase-like predicted oxidoreductase
LEEAAYRVEALKPFLTDDRPILPALALKFCLSHPAMSVVTPGMRKIANIEANRAHVGPQASCLHAPPEEIEALKVHAFAHGWSYLWSQV